MIDNPFDPSDLIALVYDENNYERGISLNQLRAMGFGRAIGVSFASEAWEALRKSRPHIMFVEWTEGRDVLDFVRRVRLSEDLPNRALSIFMLTRNGAKTEVEAARRAGVDAYLRKPISARALQQRVKAVIAHPQPFVVTASYVGPCRRRKRADFNYRGPLRRLDDEAPAPQVTGDDEELEVKGELARARVAALEAAAEALTAGDTLAARAVFHAVQNLADVAEFIGDPALALGAHEMGRYLQAQGATERLDPQVVRTHVAALHQLVHLPHALCEQRQRVAESLKRMVDKKLGGARAA
ncbi:MAG: hypothetical protein HY054_03180 [Proteobacteria bacterium]|nr:hypothetical protein [Pseudomonadota bacterium]